MNGKAHGRQLLNESPGVGIGLGHCQKHLVHPSIPDIICHSGIGGHYGNTVHDPADLLRIMAHQPTNGIMLIVVFPDFRKNRRSLLLAADHQQRGMYLPVHVPKEIPFQQNPGKIGKEQINEPHVKNSEP